MSVSTSQIWHVPLKCLELLSQWHSRQRLLLIKFVRGTELSGH